MTTQKTTKAVNEAPVASRGYSCEDCGHLFEEGELVRFHQDDPEPGFGFFSCQKCERESKETRYTIELTTEGWQIKDNENGTLLADTFGGEGLARHAAAHLNIEAGGK